MTENRTISMICKEAGALKGLENFLIGEGYQAKYVFSGDEEFTELCDDKSDAVIIDSNQSKQFAKKALQKTREYFPEMIIIVISNDSSLETVAQYIKLGATDFICSPFTTREVVCSLTKAFARNIHARENLSPKRSPWQHNSCDEIICKCYEMQKIFDLAKKVAPSDSTILITGESGTGKELLARVIHDHSLRSYMPFVPMDCSALPETLIESELFGHMKGSFTGAIETKPGLIELANGGTLFLDEIGNLDLYVQGKLLRVIQEREFTAVGGMKQKKVDMRIIAATNRNLEKMIEEGKFRKDLFYRLDIVPIHIPPLRERKSDIPLLVYHFLDKFNEKTEKKIRCISPEAMNLFVEYDWPGNVRELENIIERLIVTNDGHTIDFEHLQVHVPQEAKKSMTVPKSNKDLKCYKKKAKEQLFSEIESKFLLESLRQNNGNVTRAAKAVGMQRSNFQALMKKNGIELKKYF